MNEQKSRTKSRALTRWVGMVASSSTDFWLYRLAVCHPKQKADWKTSSPNISPSANTDSDDSEALLALLPQHHGQDIITTMNIISFSALHLHFDSINMYSMYLSTI